MLNDFTADGIALGELVSYTQCQLFMIMDATISVLEGLSASSIPAFEGPLSVKEILRLLILIFVLGFIAFLLLVLVLNKFYDLYTGGKKRPVFFDIEKTYPALLELERNYRVIRGELDSVLPHKEKMPKYHEVDLLQRKISATKDKDKDWKVFMLYAIGKKPAANRRLCPQTCALLDKIPNLFQAFFSILDGGKSIPPHPGPYRGYLRYHLGLKVPERNPPTIRVKDQYHTWQEGKSLLFDDSWEHEVYNQSDDIRTVLIVDVLRPMPPFPYAVNRLVQPLIGFFYARGILGLSEMISKLVHFFRARLKGGRA